MKDKNKQVEFIDRKEEIIQIDGAIRRWGDKKIICITGNGGIGKTRLLTEIRQQYTSTPVEFSEPLGEQKITIALVQEFTDTDWSVELLEGARNMAEDLGVTLVEFDAKFDIAKMAKQMEQAIKQKPDAIILRLGTHNEILPALQHALDKGIKVISFDNFLPDNRITTRIIQDYLDSDAQLARQMAEEIEYKGNILAIYDKNKALQSNRYHILQDVLLPYPDIYIQDHCVAVAPHMAEVVYQDVLNALKKDPQIKSIWVAWDEYTASALKAINELNRHDIYVYGYGLLAKQVDAMLAAGSLWKATVDSCPSEVGKYIIGIATSAALNEPVERHYSFKTEVIDRTYLKTLLVDGSLPSDWLKMDLHWTHRLTKRQNAFSKEKKLFPPLSILDFDDFAYHASQNILSEILLEIDTEAFNSSQKHSAFPEFDEDIQEPSSALSNENFEYVFNKTCKNNRILIFFDTVDGESRINILQEVFKAFVNLNNFVCIVAGRDALQVFDQLSGDPAWKTSVEKIDLQPLEEKYGEEYLRKKQKILGVQMDPVLVQNLLLLARGRPILIDLAVDWLARDIPLEWLKNKDPKQLEQELKGSEYESKTREFESHLIRHIGKGRRELDWLFLTMARVYPLDIFMIEKLRKVDTENAQRLFNEAKEYTFVKHLPNGRIKLHDVMQDMVAEYLWKEIDPNEDRQKRDSQIAASCYNERIQEIERHLKEDTSDSPIEQEKLMQELATVRGQYLQHLFYVDFGQATQQFKEMFENDSRTGRFSSRQILLDSVSAYIDDLPFNDKYHILTRLIRHLIDRGQHTRAKEILENLLQVPTLTSEQKLGLFTNEANYFIQIGDLLQADNSLQNAETICKENPDLENQHLGTILNTRGWVYRQMGKNKIAASYYEQALLLAKDPLKVAAILNNTGYVYSLDGKYESALQCCENSILLRNENGDIHGEGLSCATLGDIYRNKGDYEKALKYFNKAIEIFEPEKDATWLSFTYSRRGAVKRLMDNLTEARADLNESIALHVKKELPWAYHVMGCVSWNEGKLDDSLKWLERSQYLAKKIHDVHTQINNLVVTSEIFYQIWTRAATQIPNLLESVEEKMATLKSLLNQGYDFPHHHGRMLRVLADVAFSMEQYEKAMPLYAEAYALLGKRTAGYGRLTFSEELDHIESCILYIANKEGEPQTAIKWCRYFKEYWTAKQGEIMQAEGLITKCTMLETRIRLKMLTK